VQVIIAALARLCTHFLSVERTSLPPAPTYPYRACEEEQEKEKAEEPAAVEEQEPQLAAEEVREVLDALEGAESTREERSVLVATSRQAATTEQPQVVSTELEKEESVLTLQRTLRTLMAERAFGGEVEKEKEELNRVAAAVKIQARVRGFLARVLYEDMLYARAEEEQVQYTALPSLSFLLVRAQSYAFPKYGAVHSSAFTSFPSPASFFPHTCTDCIFPFHAFSFLHREPAYLPMRSAPRPRHRPGGTGTSPLSQPPLLMFGPPSTTHIPSHSPPSPFPASLIPHCCICLCAVSFVYTCISSSFVS